MLLVSPDYPQIPRFSFGGFPKLGGTFFAALILRESHYLGVYVRGPLFLQTPISYLTLRWRCPEDPAEKSEALDASQEDVERCLPSWWDRHCQLQHLGA